LLIVFGWLAGRLFNRIADEIDSDDGNDVDDEIEEADNVDRSIHTIEETIEEVEDVTGMPQRLSTVLFSIEFVFIWFFPSFHSQYNINSKTRYAKSVRVEQFVS
jgi:hypothetical protein